MVTNRGVLALLLLLVAAVHFLGCSRPRGDALVSPKMIDLGILRENEQRNTSFTLTNTSNATITVLELKTRCSCIGTRLEGDVILAAGAERRIVATVDFGSRSGDHETSVEVKWRGSRSQPIQTNEIVIRGRTESLLDLGRKDIDFGTVDQRGGKKLFSIDVSRGNSAQRWDDLVALRTSDGVEVSADRRDNDHYRITATIEPSNLPLGQTRALAKLQLRNKGENLPGFTEVPVLVRVKGTLSATPPSLYLGKISGEGVEKAVTVQSEGDDLDGAVVIADDVNIQVKSKIVNDKQLSIIIRVIAVGIEQGRPLTSSISITTTSGVKLRVPVFGFMDSHNSELGKK